LDAFKDYFPIGVFVTADLYAVTRMHRVSLLDRIDCSFIFQASKLLRECTNLGGVCRARYRFGAAAESSYLIRLITNSRSTEVTTRLACSGFNKSAIVGNGHESGGFGWTVVEDGSGLELSVTEPGVQGRRGVL
jgi:hypothetical protein